MTEFVLYKWWGGNVAKQNYCVKLLHFEKFYCSNFFSWYMYYISKINPEVKHIGKILCVKSNQISVKSKQYIKNVFSGKLSWKITKGYFNEMKFSFFMCSFTVINWSMINTFFLLHDLLYGYIQNTNKWNKFHTEYIELSNKKV